MRCHSHRRLAGQLAAALLMAVLLGGCAAAADDAGAYTDDPRNAQSGDVPPDANRALRKMANHEIETANDIYADIASQRTYSGYGSAGVAVTDTLLLPGAPPVDSLAENHLGGNDGLDAQRIIYENGGYLFWASKGANWESRSESTGASGIKQLIAGRLPWDESRLESPKTFSDGLTATVEQAIPTLLDVDDHVRELEQTIDTALGTEKLTRLIVPGETFYGETPEGVKLTLKLGKSELAAVAAGLAALRGALHYAAAYRWNWSLQEAFHTYPNDQPDGDRPDAWTDWDDSLQFLDSRLFRELSMERAQQLRKARTAFEQSLTYLIRSIDVGLASSGEGTFRWTRVDREYATKLRSFLVALRGALSEPTELPHTAPATTADFSPLFEDGRWLPEETRLFDYREVETTGGTDIDWDVREGAIQTMVVDGIFEPQFDLRENNAPDLTIGGERFDTFVENLVGPTITEFEDVYLTR